MHGGHVDNKIRRSHMRSEHPILRTPIQSTSTWQFNNTPTAFAAPKVKKPWWAPFLPFIPIGTELLSGYEPKAPAKRLIIPPVVEKTPEPISPAQPQPLPPLVKVDLKPFEDLVCDIKTPQLNGEGRIDIHTRKEEQLMPNKAPLRGIKNVGGKNDTAEALIANTIAGRDPQLKIVKYDPVIQHLITEDPDGNQISVNSRLLEKDARGRVILGNNGLPQISNQTRESKGYTIGRQYNVAEMIYANVKIPDEIKGDKDAEDAYRLEVARALGKMNGVKDSHMHGVISMEQAKNVAEAYKIPVRHSGQWKTPEDAQAFMNQKKFSEEIRTGLDAKLLETATKQAAANGISEEVYSQWTKIDDARDAFEKLDDRPDAAQQLEDALLKEGVDYLRPQKLMGTDLTVADEFKFKAATSVDEVVNYMNSPRVPSEHVNGWTSYRDAKNCMVGSETFLLPGNDDDNKIQVTVNGKEYDVQIEDDPKMAYTIYPNISAHVKNVPKTTDFKREVSLNEFDYNGEFSVDIDGVAPAKIENVRIRNGVKHGDIDNAIKAKMDEQLLAPVRTANDEVEAKKVAACNEIQEANKLIEDAKALATEEAYAEVLKQAEEQALATLEGQEVTDTDKAKAINDAKIAATNEHNNKIGIAQRAAESAKDEVRSAKFHLENAKTEAEEAKKKITQAKINQIANEVLNQYRAQATVAQGASQRQPG